VSQCRIFRRNIRAHFNVGKECGKNTHFVNPLDLFLQLLGEEEPEEVFEIENYSAVPNTKLPCWDHQRAAFWFSKNKKSAALYMDMGTGKSKVTIDILNNQEAGQVLIVCPLSVVGVWPREFGKHGAKNYQVLPLNSGSVKQKTEKARQHLELGKIRKDPTVIVVNYESLWRAPFAEFVTEQKFDSVILDESRSAKLLSIKQRLKRAMFIILGSFFTTLFAMLPLLKSGAGLLKGFALATIIGMLVSILVTRPAFADIVKKIVD